MYIRNEIQMIKSVQNIQKLTVYLKKTFIYILYIYLHIFVNVVVYIIRICEMYELCTNETNLLSLIGRIMAFNFYGNMPILSDNTYLEGNYQLHILCMCVCVCVCVM